MTKTYTYKQCWSRNQPKSLSGIETSSSQVFSQIIWQARINLNPYQGLKQALRWGKEFFIHAGINLNPYQGLKLVPKIVRRSKRLAGINLNPYQGLKLT